MISRFDIVLTKRKRLVSTLTVNYQNELDYDNKMKSKRRKF